MLNNYVLTVYVKIKLKSKLGCGNREIRIMDRWETKILVDLTVKWEEALEN